MVFFCFFTSDPGPNSEPNTCQASSEAARLDGAALRDGDARLGGTRRGTEGLDLPDELHTVNDLAEDNLDKKSKREKPCHDSAQLTCLPSNQLVTTVVINCNGVKGCKSQWL